jgi:hypothetical protein
MLALLVHLSDRLSVCLWLRPAGGEQTAPRCCTYHSRRRYCNKCCTTWMQWADALRGKELRARGCSTKHGPQRRQAGRKGQQYAASWSRTALSSELSELWDLYL